MNDVNHLIYRLYNSKWYRHKFLARELSKTSDKLFPLLLFHPADPNPKLQNVLITGCFHGNEPSGSHGIVEFMEQSSLNLSTSVNYSFLPIVNPAGLKRNSRFNNKKLDVNRGFIESSKHELSVETKALIQNAKILSELGSDLVISFHEYDYQSDIHETGNSFIVSVADNAKNNKQLMNIMNTLSKRGKLMSSECLEDLLYDWVGNIEGYKLLHDGLVETVSQDMIFDSFDDYAYYVMGCKTAVTIELNYENGLRKNVCTVKKVLENLTNVDI
jgi:hypothetical protein